VLSFVVAALAVVLLLPAAMTALHLGVMATSSLFFRDRRPPTTVPPVRFLVVIPAHNEELLLGTTLDAVMANIRDRDQVLVVDDRSEDRTGEIAAERGAIVLRREPGEEPGRAPARQAAIALSRTMEWDAMVMIDADSVVADGFFDRCEEALADGTAALQARSEAAKGRRLVDLVALASFAIQGVTLPRGREALGLPVRLRGTGMVLRRDVVEKMEFRAKASEDLQVSLDLVQEGVGIHHVETAQLRSANADSWKIASTQKQRYEAGRMGAAREFVPQLLRHHSVASLEAAWFIVSPPFAMAAGLGAMSAILAALAGAWPLFWVAVAMVALLGWCFVVASVQARVGPRIILAVLFAPAYIVWKLAIQLRAALRMRGGVKEFGATARQ